MGRLENFGVRGHPSDVGRRAFLDRHPAAVSSLASPIVVAPARGDEPWAPGGGAGAEDPDAAGAARHATAPCPAPTPVIHAILTQLKAGEISAKIVPADTYSSKTLQL